jgi:tetratricopeptide (TPR) repeat protein
MMTRVLVLLVLATTAGAGCHRRVGDRPLPPTAGAEAKPAAANAAKASDAVAVAAAKPDKAGDETSEPPPRPLRRCFPERPTWLDAPVGTLLDRAADLYDASDFVGALACAEEAARQAPRSVEAHHNRAIALLRLDRMEEARDALTLALALAPDDPETLEAAADLNINQLAPSVDRSAIGLEYARRASRHVSRGDHEQVARLALLEGQSLIDLGRASEALRRIDAALAASPRFAAAMYERGVALFELCRFDDARRVFEKVLVSTPDHAHALYHLGLIEERSGDEASSARHLAAATAADPKAFPPAPAISQADFAARVKRSVAELPADIRHDLGGIKVEAADLPDEADLTAEKPPLSPTILGLFRGLPLDFNEKDAAQPAQAGRSSKGRAAAASAGLKETDGTAGPGVHGSSGAGPQCDAGDRTIVLYRRNLLRTVHDGAELDQAITRTLLHEVGHLRGEDDGSLRDRGLE